jgi:hypothetical protein
MGAAQSLAAAASQEGAEVQVTMVVEPLLAAAKHLDSTRGQHRR